VIQVGDLIDRGPDSEASLTSWMQFHPDDGYVPFDQVHGHSSALPSAIRPGAVPTGSANVRRLIGKRGM